MAPTPHAHGALGGLAGDLEAADARRAARREAPLARGEVGLGAVGVPDTTFQRSGKRRGWRRTEQPPATASIGPIVEQPHPGAAGRGASPGRAARRTPRARHRRRPHEVGQRVVGHPHEAHEAGADLYAGARAAPHALDEEHHR